MGLFLANGTRVTKSSVSKTTDPDPLVTINTDLYQREKFNDSDPAPNGGKLTLFCRAGKQLRQSQLDLLFPAPTVDSITPKNGLAAGGTVLTIKGRDLDGVTGVTVGGNAGTSLVHVSPTELKVTTAAHAAGATNVVVTNADGSTTKTGAFTFA